MLLTVKQGQHISREAVLSRLIEMLYERNDMNFSRGRFRVRGDVVEVYPGSADEEGVRIEFFGDEIEAITKFDPLTGHAHESLSVITFYPAKQFVTPADKLNRALRTIREELEQRIVELESQNKLLEAQRLRMRTEYDLEMLQEMGFCNGIENYSRHLSGRPPGSKPYTIIDFFPKDFLVVIDESHATIPQIGGMYEGDRSRKTVLVNYGFRLPSALDNRPFNFDEFMKMTNQIIYVSATPAEFEIQNSIVGNKSYMPHRRQRIAEEELVRGLRAADFDILVGINLLREGLDLPEVSLVCILDADKEGFLRSQTSLIQTAGRAARHVNGEVVLFADIVTQSMEALISISEYRRAKQVEYNEKHGITPQTVRRAVQESLHTILRGSEIESSVIREHGRDFNLTELLRELEEEMQQASANLEFERAALLRDQIMEVKSGAGISKIEPKRRPVKYSSRGRGTGRRRSRV